MRCTNATDGSGATAGGSAGAALQAEDTIEDTVPVKLPQLSDVLFCRSSCRYGSTRSPGMWWHTRSAQLPECLRLAPCVLTSHCFLIPVVAGLAALETPLLSPAAECPALSSGQRLPSPDRAGGRAHTATLCSVWTAMDRVRAASSCKVC